MELADYVIQVASDPSIRAAAPIHLAACLPRKVDAKTDYTITDADPRVIATELGYAPANIYKALSALEQRGYVEWRRVAGLKGSSIRILLPSQS